MKSKTICALLAVSIASSTSFAAPHVTIAEARKIALARVPGTIVHEKLKHAKKKKHAHDRYNIKVAPRDGAKHDSVKKVEVDAETGVILEVRTVKAKSYDD